MSKVWGMHMVTLRPGIKAEDFEKFMMTDVAKLPMYDGWKVRLLKGERGERKGEYMVLIEIDSLEARNRFSPEPDKASPEADEFDKSHPEGNQVFEKWATLATVPGQATMYTDYVEVG